MVADIVLALIIFFWVIPLALAGILWLAVKAFERPMHVLVGVIVAGLIIAAMLSN